MTRGGKTAWAAAAFALAAVVACGRIVQKLDAPAPPFRPDAALVDFRDAVYYPVVALLAGENPYDRERMRARYPIEGTIGLYSPLALLVHLPWGLLPYRSAEAGWVAWSLGLVVVLAASALRIAGRKAEPAAVLALAAFLVLTRPGNWNLFLGQVACETGLATLAALWWARSRPLLSGLGFALATVKATYALPLAVLMAARRDGRALACGLGLMVLLTAPPLGAVVARAGVAGFVGDLRANYETRVATPRFDASFSPFRVDVVALTARALGRAPGSAATLALGAAVVLVAAFALHRGAASDAPETRRRSLAIASLAILLCGYHQQYDVLLLAPLLAAAWPGAGWRPRRDPAALAALFAAVPFLNYLASGAFQRASGMERGALLAVSSANAVALLAAFAVLVGAAWREDAR